MRRMRICFTDVFFCFFLFFFRPSQKNRQPFSGTAERIFMKLLPNDRKWSFQRRTQMGLGPRLFLGAKNYTLHTWWWRLANYSKNYFMLVCWLWHCAATAVALQMHEGVNAFNLVCLGLLFKRRVWFVFLSVQKYKITCSVHQCMRTGFRGRISRKRLEIETWFQWTTNRKWS